MRIYIPIGNDGITRNGPVPLIRVIPPAAAPRGALTTRPTVERLTPQRRELFLRRVGMRRDGLLRARRPLTGGMPAGSPRCRATPPGWPEFCSRAATS